MRLLSRRLSAPVMLAAVGCSATEADPARDHGPPGAQVLTIEGVATWKGAAKGAYSIIHDDACDYPVDSLFELADPELAARGLRAGFGAIVQRCDERGLWERLETLKSHGHEIICHSWSHASLVNNTALDIEVDQATRTLDTKLENQNTSFFIFPYDEFDDGLIGRLARLGYLGARAGPRGLNDAEFSDAMRTSFDVYGGMYSIYDGLGDILKIYVDLAISEGGWASREFHGVADTTFFPVPLDVYRAHLDYVKAKVDAGELWMDTPTAIVKYRFAREHCGPPSASGWTLQFPAPSDVCATYSTPLTVIVTTEVDFQALYAEQDGAAVMTAKLGPRRYTVNVFPSGGVTTVIGSD